MKKEFGLEVQRKYLRIPFTDSGRSFDGCDCGGLVWLIYKEELGIELPNWTDLYGNTRISSAKELFETVSTMLGANGVEVPLSEARPYDVLAIRIGNDPIHVGIIVKRFYFIHTVQKVGPSIEPYGGINWGKRIAGCYRHEKMFNI